MDQTTPAWTTFAADQTPSRPDTALYSEKSGSGDPVILLHGFGNSTYTWRHIAPALAKTHRVIALDLKGFGYSPKPMDDRYSIYEQGRLVRDYVIAHHLQNVTLVGQSYGGGVALVATLLLAEASPATQRALVLIDSIAYPQALPAFIRILTTPLLGPLALNLVPAETQVGEVMKEVFYQDAAIPADAVTAYAHGLLSRQGRCAAWSTAKQVLPQDLSSLAERYATIRLPTLLVWGRHDEIVPLSVANRLHSAIPNSRLVLIEDSGHAPQDEQPAKLISVLEPFLERVQGPKER